MQMAIAFIAGMIVTVALAQTPVAPDIFAPQSSHEPIVPAPPDIRDFLKPGGSPDTTPAKYPVSELVFTFTKAVSSC